MVVAMETIDLEEAEDEIHRRHTAADHCPLPSSYNYF